VSRLVIVVTVLVATTVFLEIGHAGPRRSPPAVAKLFEDDAETLLRALTNPTGDPGEGHVETKDVFSGRRSIKILPMQRFHPAVPGWAFRIAECPKDGEFRYLRFAWKADGCAGIMLQLHDDRDWTIRYTAGIDQFNWGSKFVAVRPPSAWTVVTCDLFADFGPRTIHGIALTAFNGKAAYFDHIYLGRTVDDLDRIDATDAASAPRVRLAANDLDGLWADLSGRHAPRTYAAFWRLVAAADQAVPFLAEKLGPPGSPEPAVAQIRKWVRDLDDDAFRVREAATAALAAHLDTVATELEGVARSTASPEVRARATRLLALRDGVSPERDRFEKAVRVLEYAESPEAKAVLERLAGAGRAGVSGPARAALKRLAEGGP
jgi:hypothetical protein